MKKSLFFILSFMLFYSVQAEGIVFFTGSFEEAKKAAAAEGKLIFMDAYASWCGPCKMMSNNVFPLDNVGAYFNDNFINLKIDMEKGEGLDLRKKYAVSAYPTLFILDSNGDVVLTTKGAKSADALIDWAKTANQPNPSLTKKLFEKYEAGDRSPALMRDLIKVKANNREDYSALFTEYLSNLSEEQKLENENADFIFNQTQGLQSPGLKVLKDYESYFKDIKGEDVYNAKLTSIATQVANTAIKQKNLEEVNKAIAFLKTYKPSNYKEVSSELLVNYYGNSQDWVQYDKTVTKHLSIYKKGNDQAYREVAWNYYMNIDDEAKLKKAEKWMQESIKISNSYENNLTQAYLLYKLEAYSEAEDAVKYALILAGEKKKTENAQILKDQILNKLNKKEIVE